MFWHEYAKTPRVACKNPIAKGDFHWIFARNCEGTEQLRTEAVSAVISFFIQKNLLLLFHFHLAVLAVFDLLFDIRIKASRPLWPSSPLKRLLTDTTTPSSSFWPTTSIYGIFSIWPRESCSRSSQTGCPSLHGYRPLSAQQDFLAIFHVFIRDRQHRLPVPEPARSGMRLRSARSEFR